MENKLLTTLIDFENLERSDDDSYIANFYMDPKSEIFDGHFPSQPVLPGVIMVNIVKRCIEQVEGKAMQLSKAGNIKFLSLLVPNERAYTMKLAIKKEEELFKVNAQLIQEDTIYFKQNAIYKVRK